jgi:hypothetical protein
MLLQSLVWNSLGIYEVMKKHPEASFREPRVVAIDTYLPFRFLALRAA